jgi:hypothetical protein
MIFLAVSGFIFASAMILMSGKQDRTEFSTGIAQLTSELQTIVGDVAGGYYSTQNNFSCVPNSNGQPTINPGSNLRGASSGCIFIGEVIQFDPNVDVAAAFSASTNQTYMVYPIVGNQFQPNPNNTLEVTSLSNTKPKALYIASDLASDEQTLPFGISISYMDYVDSSLASSGNNCVTGTISVPSAMCIGAVGLFTTFNGNFNPAGSGSTKLLQSGSQSVGIFPIPPPTSGGPLNETQLNMFSQISNLTNNGTNNIITDGSDSTLSTVSDPDGGVQICFNSGTDRESGLITLGGSNNPSLVTLKNFSQPGCIT